MHNGVFFSRCWRCLEGCLPFPGQTQKIPTTTPWSPVYFMAAWPSFKDAGSLGSCGGCQRNSWSGDGSTWRWYSDDFSMIKMTDASGQRYKYHPHRGVAVRSYGILWWKPWHPKPSIFASHLPETISFWDWFQLALSLGLQEKGWPSKAKASVINSTLCTPKIRWLFLKEMSGNQSWRCFFVARKIAGKLQKSFKIKKQHPGPVLNIHQQEQLVCSIDKNYIKKTNMLFRKKTETKSLSDTRFESLRSKNQNDNQDQGF